MISRSDAQPDTKKVRTMELSPTNKRTLGGAARCLSHTEGISCAGAVARIKKDPTVLAEMASDFTDLQTALPATRPPEDAAVEDYDAGL